MINFVYYNSKKDLLIELKINWKLIEFNFLGEEIDI